MADLACKDGGLKLRLCPKHGARKAPLCRWCLQVHGIISAHQASHPELRPRPAPPTPVPTPVRCNSANHKWTEDRTKLAVQLWADGYSANQIAARVGGVSRNAVIGKIHRLGLSGRASPAPRMYPKKTGPRKQRLRRRPQINNPTPLAALFAGEPYTPPPKPHIPEGERKTLLQLEDGDCRFPCSDEPPHTFCARPKVQGLPYCEVHARICFRAPDPKAGRPIPGSVFNRRSVVTGQITTSTLKVLDLEEV